MNGRIWVGRTPVRSEAASRDYRVVARIKNNHLWGAIRRVWPDIETQSEAAGRLGVTPGLIGQWLNMVSLPVCAYRDRLVGADETTIEQHEEKHQCRAGWSTRAWTIAGVLRETPDYLFDPDLYGRRPHVVEVELDRPALAAGGFLALPLLPDEEIAHRERSEAVEKALASLTRRQEQVLRLRFGLDEAEMTLKEIGDSLHLTDSRVARIEATALRKLRSPRSPLRHVL